MNKQKSCQDNNAWVDNEGYSCAEYYENNWCVEEEHTHTDIFLDSNFVDRTNAGGIDARMACCLCGKPGNGKCN